jgi:chromosome segregation ATPase
MSTYDARLSALEKDVTVMKQDIVYKLDETNTVVTAILGVVGTHGRDLKQVMKRLESLDNRVEGIDARLAKSEVQLEGLIQDVRAVQEQQDVQGRDLKDIKRRLDGFDQRFVGIDQRFDGIDQRFDGIDQRFDGIDQRFVSIDQRFDGIDQRFTSLEEKFDRRFEQVLQVLATLTNKAE